MCVIKKGWIGVTGSNYRRSSKSKHYKYWKSNVRMNMVAQRTEREYEEKKWYKNEVEEGGMNWKSSIDIHTPPCVKQISIGKLLHSTGRAQLCALWWPRGVAWGRLRGRLKREGIFVYLQLIRTVVQEKLIQHCKAIILPLKKKRWGRLWETLYGICYKRLDFLLRTMVRLLKNFKKRNKIINLHFWKIFLIRRIKVEDWRQ